MPLTLPQRIALAVRAEKRARDVTQRWLAEKLNLSQPQVWERLNGVVEWRTSELDRLAVLWDIPVDQLLTEPASELTALEPAERAA